MFIKMAVLVSSIAAGSAFHEGGCSDVDDDDDNYCMLFLWRSVNTLDMFAVSTFTHTCSQ